MDKKFKQKSNEQFLVSIITPVYNSSKYVQETIHSIQKQTYKNWELLITDDCSEDNSWEIIREMAKSDSRIKAFRLTENSGAGVARNHSLSHAKGKYIAFCDSDDVWHAEKLEKQLKFLRDQDLAFTFSSYQKMNENGVKGGTIEAPQKVSYDDLLKTCSIGCLTAIYDTEKIGKVYMPEIRKRQDYGLWLKIFKRIGSTKGMNEVLANYRERPDSVSGNKIDAAKYHFRVLRDVARVPLTKSWYYFFIYVIAGSLKYIK